VLTKLYLTPEDLQKLETMTPEKIEQHMAKLFGLVDYEQDLKTACFLDYYVTQYWWAAKQKQFNQEQIAHFFTIAYLLMDSLKSKKRIKKSSVISQLFMLIFILKLNKANFTRILSFLNQF
jgi:hypothetical protein